METKRTVCPLDCPDSCGMIATLEAGRVTELNGDKEHPYTRGVICRKMRGYPQRLYMKDRLLEPLLRVGPKGAAEFRPISWDAALELMAERLQEVQQRYGGEAILPYAYAGNMGLVNRFAGFPLFHKLNASRLEQTICSAAAGSGWEKQCATLPGSPPEQAAEASLVVAWGINIKVTNLHFWQYVARARKQGARLVVIDPYRNATASSADEHLMVRPGGDTALALGLLKQLIQDQGLDQAFIRQHTRGFATLAAYLGELGWEELTRQSGISRAAIHNLARLLVSNPQTFVRIGVGLSRNSRGGMAVRAITALAAGLGLFRGGPGRGVLLFSGAFRGKQEKLCYPALASEASRRVNMIHLGHALTRLQPPVRALVVYNANPLSANPDTTMVRQGLARDDLFTVVHEQLMTPTARYADLLLPATTFLENHDLYSGYGHFYLQVARPVVEPQGQARSNFELFQGLARQMGFSDPPFLQSCEERILDYLQDLEGLPKGIDPEEVLAGQPVLSSRSCSPEGPLIQLGGSYDFAPSGIGPEPSIPCLTPGGEFTDPDLLARFPLRLIIPPHDDLLNSTFGERYPGRVGEVLVHPQDAAPLKIGDQTRVWLYNHRGRVQRLARISSDTQPGLVVAEGLFWPQESVEHPDEGAAINDLTSQKVSDMGGGATFHESLVGLAPVDEGP
ncbi:molybdopterin-containing oxidoreductase family protein [Desulfogranum mediterraneum]|uniref:molybdopterin-containing oxidoreductase family protein n=1 Tax=Desulfogranum mediterraneum TaxID=160661 RepID=UPI0003FAB8AB|nr:molybdopterin-dependent oxidoreductase [Desulfogranum mediterraneum]